MVDSFTHLHLHTEYSMLDGAARVKDVVQKAAEDGQPAVGITDHGNMYGVVDFYKTCQEVGIKPVIGTEAYMALDSRDERPKRGKAKADDGGGDTEKGQKLYYHTTLLAENNTGYKNLIQIASRAFLEGYYYKPRVDWEVLSDHSEGVIATSGCLGGQVLQQLLHDDYDEALRRAGMFQDIFGRDNFFIEIQDHGIPEQNRTNPDLFKIADALNAPLLLTNDSHYTNEEDHLPHDALLCQPPDTLVTVVAGRRDGTYHYEDRPISKIKSGDRVLSWTPSPRRGRMRLSGSVVSEVASRQHDGSLIVVEAEGRRSSYTPEHICAVRLDCEPKEGNHVVYLMKKGGSYRIGVTSYQRQRSKIRPVGGVLGLVARANEQNADAVWALSFHESKIEALEQEAWLSISHGIPTWSFEGCRSETMNPRTPIYGSLWARLGDITDRAEECLSRFGRLLEYPLWDRKTQAPGQQKPYFVRACNLFSGIKVCIPDSRTSGKYDTNDGSGVWHAADVSKEFYQGEVVSLDVEGDRTYVADGIVTHNCIQTRAKIKDTDRFKFHGTEHYLKTAEEMRRLFPDHPEASDNTLWIAERAHVDIEFGKMHLPIYDYPEKYESDHAYLEALVLAGAKKRWGNPLPQEYADRLSYELRIIKDMGFSSYFLIVWDLTRFAREQKIRMGPARGSAGGCAVSYCMGITEIDPIKYDLLFERFLNPSRISEEMVQYEPQLKVLQNTKHR